MKNERVEELEENEKQIYKKILADEELSYNEQEYILFDWDGDGKLADLVDVKRPITNKELALKTLKKGYISDWLMFSEELRSDKEIIHTLIDHKDEEKQEFEFILYKCGLGEKIKTDKECVLKLTEVAPEYTHDFIRNQDSIMSDKELLMKLIEIDPFGTANYFCDANEELRNDKEFASFALDTLDSNPELFGEDEFIEYKGYMYDSIGDKLKNDKEFKDRLEKINTDIESNSLDYGTTNNKRR